MDFLDENCSSGKLSSRDLYIRHAKYYIATLHSADKMYESGDVGVREGLDVFDCEHTQLDSARLWLQSQMIDELVDDLLVADAVATAHIGSFRYDLKQEWIPQLEIACLAAKRRNEMLAYGRIMGNLGAAYWMLGEPSRAIEYFNQHLAVAREIGARADESRALGNLGISYYDLGDPYQSIAYHEQSLAIACELGERRLEGNALGNLGAAYQILGDLHKTVVYCEQHLAIMRELGDKSIEGRALSNLGAAFRGLGEIDRAVENYNQALAIAREIGDRRGEAIALSNLGATYFVLGEMQQCVAYNENSLEIARKVADRSLEGRALCNLGNAYFMLKEASKSILFYDQYLNIARSMGDLRAQGYALDNIGITHSLLGDIEQALIKCEEALKIARSIGDRLLEAAVLGHMASFYASKVQVAEANEFYMRSIDIYELTNSYADVFNVKWDYGIFLAQNGERERGIALLEDCVNYENRIGHTQAAEHIAILDNIRKGEEFSV